MRRLMQALKLFEDGMDKQQISEEMGISLTTVSRYLREAYGHSDRVRAREERLRQRSIKAQDPMNTRRGRVQYLYRVKDMNFTEIAQEMGLAESTVRRYMYKDTVWQQDYKDCYPKFLHEPDRIEEMVKYKTRHGIWKWKEASDV